MKPKSIVWYVFQCFLWLLMSSEAHYRLWISLLLSQPHWIFYKASRSSGDTTIFKSIEYALLCISLLYLYIINGVRLRMTCDVCCSRVSKLITALDGVWRFVWDENIVCLTRLKKPFLFYDFSSNYFFPKVSLPAQKKYWSESPNSAQVWNASFEGSIHYSKKPQQHKDTTEAEAPMGPGLHHE